MHDKALVLLAVFFFTEVFWIFAEKFEFEFGSKSFGGGEVDHAVLWNSLTKHEQSTLRQMSSDRAIAQNLASSLFPNIYGNDEVSLSPRTP